MQEITSVWTVLVAIIAAAVSWGGSRHAISVLKEEIVEAKKMNDQIREEMKESVSGKFCRIERQDCKMSRKENAEAIGKKIDDLMDRIDLQDQKRHDHSNKVQIIYGELLTKLTSLEAIMQERSRRFRKDDPQYD
jgi:hypothetical protein